MSVNIYENSALKRVDGMPVDGALSGTSINPVQNKVVKEAIDELNYNLANLETATSHLGNRLSYITECAVGSSKTISNYKKYAIIFLCLNSGSTMVACMPFGASETDLRFNDGTNHTARVTYSISGDDITFTVTNRENASGYAVLFRALTIV